MQRQPAIFLIFVTSSFAFPQDVPEPRYKVEVDAALYEVRVRNETGESISGLELEDFIVLEEGKPRPIVFFSEQTDEPVTVAILLDQGSAMSQESVLKGKELIFDLIHLLDPQDLILVATFGEEVDVLSDLTSDRHALLESIENIYSGARPTRWSWASPTLTGVENAATLGIRFSPSNSNTGDAVDAALAQIIGASNPEQGHSGHLGRLSEPGRTHAGSFEIGWGAFFWDRSGLQAGPPAEPRSGQNGPKSG